MSEHDKWKMFKNYLHNELSITKDDIESWVKEAVEHIAEKYVAEHMPKSIISQKILDIFYVKTSFGGHEIKKEIVQAIAKDLAGQLDVVVVPKQEAKP